MRNLKKLLALVLAMVMAFSLMLSASAATVKFEDYQDKDSITAEFKEAVQVLTGLKVFQGDEKGFRPSDSITRAEAAAIVYRLATGDVEDRQTELYKDYSTFTDVNPGDWFAGYVGYCQNAGYIKGTTPKTFNPYGKVTGYEALAMILRVVGYGKNNEFTGASWQVNVAALSKELGVTKNVTAAHMDQTLNMAAPREVVADLMFMTSTIVPTVTYTPALAYNDKQSIAGSNAGIFNPTLGQKTFGLYHDYEWKVVDEWGRPGYHWYKNGVWNNTVTNGWNGSAYAVKENHPLYVSATTVPSKVATIVMDPDLEFHETKLECDIAHELKFDGEKEFYLFVNSEDWTTDTYRIVATDTVTKVGGQGRVSEFYYKITNPWFRTTSDVNVAVMIDTMLARVNNKTDAKLDPAGHVIVPARLEVTLYDGATANIARNNGSQPFVITKASDDDTNWEYNKGDMLLLHAWTDDRTGSDVNKEKAAFEADDVIGGNNTAQNNGILEIDAEVWIDGIAKSIQGKQTVTSWNSGKHTVDGKEYNDQLCLFLDQAGTSINTTFNWYFDQYDNIIGIGPASSVNYGVITSVYAAFGTGDANTNTTGTAKAVATVKYADGTEGTVTIDRFLVSNNADGAANTHGMGKTMLDSTTTGNTAVELWPVYDTHDNEPMTSELTSTAYPNVTFTPSHATVTGVLYMAPAAVTNTYNSATDTTNNINGVLKNNLFKFVTASDESVIAVEVAGAGTTLPNGAAGDNTGIYAGQFNGAVQQGQEKLYKNLGYITLNDANGTGAATVRLDNETKIMVRNPNSGTINTYDGVSALPGDVDLYWDADVNRYKEVDWADTDGDGRAEYVYLTGTIPGVVTYGLFYFNGGAAQWNGTTGTAEGYLNGEAKTLTFTNKGQFDAVTNSADYDGHLFAVQMTNGNVSAVMIADNEVAGTNKGNRLLADYTTAGTPVNTNNVVLKLATNQTSDTTGTNIDLSATDATHFGLGVLNGNPYTKTTEAVYFRASAGTDAARSHLRYATESYGNKIVVTGVGAGDYWLAPEVKVIGELYWLNDRECDVTMVYENNAAKSVVEIYIDPDITPDGYAGAGVPSFAQTVVPSSAKNLPRAGKDAWVKSLANGGYRFDTDMSMAGDAPNTASTMYFKFESSVANCGNAVLNIVNSTGTNVYTETLNCGSAANVHHYFYVDFSVGSSNNQGSTTGDAGNVWNSAPLPAGTYYYSITCSIGTIVGGSNGSFTIG